MGHLQNVGSGRPRVFVRPLFVRVFIARPRLSVHALRLGSFNHILVEEQRLVFVDFLRNDVVGCRVIARTHCLGRTQSRIDLDVLLLLALQLSSWCSHPNGYFIVYLIAQWSSLCGLMKLLLRRFGCRLIQYVL